MRHREILLLQKACCPKPLFLGCSRKSVILWEPIPPYKHFIHMTDRQILLDELYTFRRELHRYPELSGQEQQTAERVRRFLARYHPHSLYSSIGGEGVAAVYNGAGEGPTVMIRCELDALPIHETGDFNYRSGSEGVSHKCGHDGHMSIVAGLAALLHRHPPVRGRVVLLFQPAEETGAGAERVIADERFAALKPDYAFALHNLPGYPLGTVLLRNDVFAAASKGMIIRLHGATSHAAHPEDARSPARAMAETVLQLDGLHRRDGYSDFTLLTVIHARLGEQAFGTTPGYAEVMATLRAYRQSDIHLLTERAEAVAREVAVRYALGSDIEYVEEFPATVSHPEAMQVLRRAVQRTGAPVMEIAEPFRWSEDFGHFAQVGHTAFFGVGSGTQHPQLHHPTYDFPDDVTATGLTVFEAVVRELLG